MTISDHERASIFDKRTIGDYDDFAEFTKDEVSGMYDNLKDFIKKTEEL